MYSFRKNPFHYFSAVFNELPHHEAFIISYYIGGKMKTARNIRQDITALKIHAVEYFKIERYLSSLDSEEMLQVKFFLFEMLYSQNDFDVNWAAQIIKSENYQDMIPELEKMLFEYDRTGFRYYKLLELLLALGHMNIAIAALSYLETCKIANRYDKILSYLMVVLPDLYVNEVSKYFKLLLDNGIHIVELSSRLSTYYRYAEEVKRIPVFNKMIIKLILMSDYTEKINKAMRFKNMAVKPSVAPEHR